MYRVGWFSTGRGQGSRALLQAIHDSITSGEVNASIEFVFCSRDPGEAEPTDAYLKLARGYGYPVVTFSYQKYRRARRQRTPPPGEPMPQWRLDYDREVMARLARFKPDLCVLAGYMLILGPELCQRYNFINLHPAAPWGPTGIWQDVIWKLIETDARASGVMMHLAVPELDRGPVVTYCTFPIRGPAFDHHWEEVRRRSLEEVRRTEGADNALFKAIRQHGAARELPLVVATVRAFAEGRVRITADKQVVDASGKITAGQDLTPEIERRLSRQLP